MAVCTITITDITKTPQNLYNLFTQATVAGYTVKTASPSTPTVPILIASVTYLSIQASYTNAGTIVYKGNAGVKTDGTCQAKELAAGDTDVQQAPDYSTNLNDIYITASANGAVVNVEVHHG